MAWTLFYISYIIFYLLIYLIFSYLLVFLIQPKDGVGVLNRPLMLHCAVYDSSPQMALPVKWEKENGALTTGVHQMANGSLFFSWLEEENLGEYICSARKGSQQIRSVVKVDKACMYVDVQYVPSTSCAAWIG